MPVETINQRIRRLRTKKGLSQKDLAATVGVAYQSVQEWERQGGTAPSRKRQEAVAAALGVSHQELMAGAPSVPTPLSEGKDVQRLIVAFGWLTDEQQKSLLADLESKAATNKAISRELGSRWEYKSDEHVGNHIKPAPKHSPLKKPKRSGHNGD